MTDKDAVFGMKKLLPEKKHKGGEKCDSKFDLLERIPGKFIHKMLPLHSSIFLRASIFSMSFFIASVITFHKKSYIILKAYRITNQSIK